MKHAVVAQSLLKSCESLDLFVYADELQALRHNMPIARHWVMVNAQSAAAFSLEVYERRPRDSSTMGRVLISVVMIRMGPREFERTSRLRDSKRFVEEPEEGVLSDWVLLRANSGRLPESSPSHLGDAGANADSIVRNVFDDVGRSELLDAFVFKRPGSPVPQIRM